MAKSCCVLCGSEVGWMDRLSLTVFDTEQTVCSDCEKKFRNALPSEQEQLRRQILESPHLSNRSAVEAYQKAVSDKFCPACGSAMERKLKDFTIGADGYGGLTSLGLPQYMVDLYACPKCGKVELYTANFKTEEEQAKAGPVSVTCPECGKEHSPLIHCPVCALRAASSGRRPAPSASKKKEARPPWEK